MTGNKDSLQNADIKLYGGADLPDNGNIAKKCAYNRSGVCILSDCPCQGTADGRMVCSSFKLRL